MRFLLALLFIGFAGAVAGQHILFPDTVSWNHLEEGRMFHFQLRTDAHQAPRYSVEGTNEYRIQFDSSGRFWWQPSFDLVDRLEKVKEVTIMFQAIWPDGHKVRQPITFHIAHVNRPPVIEELPVFYVRQMTSNQFQISSDYVTDPDGDPITFRMPQSQLPEGASFSALGLLTWSPSRSQYNSLRNAPLLLDIIAQDQPMRAEAYGKIKIMQSQLDLPPDLLIVPADSVIRLKEGELINLQFYLSDPNGDDNLTGMDFVASDKRIGKERLRENSQVQWEFIWTPGYDLVDEAEKVKAIDLRFVAFDKSKNRDEKKVRLIVDDAENLEEKDKLLYQRYRLTLTAAKSLIDQLDKNHEQLSKAYKQAKKGKKNRAILNASLGAATGLSPLVLETEPAQVVSGVGGTAVLTMGTLEATEVIGKSKNEILDKQKINIEIRNQLQVEADNFARKYALKSTRRNKDFDVDREKLLPILNNQKLVILELEADKSAYPNYSNKDLKKSFPDFAEE
jgi:hypothetical protein